MGLVLRIGSVLGGSSGLVLGGSIGSVRVKRMFYTPVLVLVEHISPDSRVLAQHTLLDLNSSLRKLPVQRPVIPAPR